MEEEQRKDLISVIVPAYNAEKYLQKCVESIQGQSYQHFEVILVDDGSQDHTGMICDEFAKKDSRIRVIHQKNSGVSSARNMGMEAASGQYFSFVDSDDYVDPDYLSMLYDAIRTSGCLIAECGQHRIPETENDFRKEDTVREPKRLTVQEWGTETGMKGYLSMIVISKLFDAKMFQTIRFPEGRVYEDEAVIYKLIYEAKTIQRLYNKLYYYRSVPTGITKSEMTDKKIADSILAREERIAYFEEHKEPLLAAYSRAKLCILLINYYRQEKKKRNDKDRLDHYYQEVKKTYKMVARERKVVLKYRAYIATFICAPWFF